MKYKPTEKAPELDAEITRLTGVDRKATITAGKCSFEKLGCTNPNFNFRDTLSESEYRISGLCQACQDKMFGGDQ